MFVKIGKIVLNTDFIVSIQPRDDGGYKVIYDTPTDRNVTIKNVEYEQLMKALGKAHGFIEIQPPH